MRSATLNLSSSVARFVLNVNFELCALISYFVRIEIKLPILIRNQSLDLSLVACSLIYFMQSSICALN